MCYKTNYQVKGHQSTKQVKNNKDFLNVIQIYLLCQTQEQHKNPRLCALYRKRWNAANNKISNKYNFGKLQANKKYKQLLKYSMIH